MLLCELRLIRCSVLVDHLHRLSCVFLNDWAFRGCLQSGWFHGLLHGLDLGLGHWDWGSHWYRRVHHIRVKRRPSIRSLLLNEGLLLLLNLWLRSVKSRGGLWPLRSLFKLLQLHDHSLLLSGLLRIKGDLGRLLPCKA